MTVMQKEIRFKYELGEVVYQKTTGEPLMIIGYFIDISGVMYKTDDGEFRYDIELSNTNYNHLLN